MSTFPKPPGFASENRIPKPDASPVYKPAPPPEDIKRDEESETDFILRTTLSPADRIDSNILKFIDSYMHCRNATQAAREAGFPKPDIGRRLLMRSDIHACISKLTQKLTMKFGYDESEVVERVKEVAGIDPLDVFDDDGKFKKPKDIPPAVRRVIKKWKVKQTFLYDPNNQPMTDAKGNHIVETEILEMEFWDKMKAVELLGREKSLFKENKTIVHDVGSNMRSVLLESTKRAETRLLQMKDVTPVIDVEDEQE